LAALLGTPNDQNGIENRKGDAPSLSTPNHGADDQSQTGASGRISDIFQLNVYEIDDNPFQPRREFGQTEIDSLSESLKEHDMLQPILVRRVDERYQLISGERRLRAAIQAGWSQVPARIRDADDRLVAELAIVENLQRKDLNAIEKALSFKRYIDEHECTQDDLAQRLKIDRSTIANLMRLLELPPPVLEGVRTSKISAGHARALLPLGEESEQIQFCKQIIGDGWSVRETERRVAEAVCDVDDNILDMAGERRSKRTESDQVASLEQELRIALGTKIDIRQSKKGRGKIIVHFSDHDEFDRLRALLSGTAGHLVLDHQVGNQDIA
jgi:ParB family chromosome partitioning protein